MTQSWVCVDASVVVKLVVEEVFSDEARSLWRTWQNERYEIAAPPLLCYEVTSVLRRHVVRGLRTVEESQQALERTLAFDIYYLEPADFHRRAFYIADRLGRPAAYDAHYLAVAEYLDCEFWTADQRLVNAVQGSLSWVKWLGRANVSTTKE